MSASLPTRSVNWLKKGGNNKTKARFEVYAQISDCRMDTIHKASRALINENQAVCVEDGAVKHMRQSIAEWAAFVIFPSSKPCLGCGYIHGSMPSICEWDCPECSTLG